MTKIAPATTTITRNPPTSPVVPGAPRSARDVTPLFARSAFEGVTTSSSTRRAAVPMPAAPVDVDPSLYAAEEARHLAGEGASHAAVTPYVLCVPSDGDMAPADLMRVVVTDVLRRNGRPTDAVSVETAVEALQAGGGFDFNRSAGGANMATRAVKKGPGGTSYEGYALKLREDFQTSVLGAVDAVRREPISASTPESRERLAQLFHKMSEAARLSGDKDAVALFDTLKNTIRANDADGFSEAVNGTKAGLSSLQTVLEVVQRAPGDPALKAAAGELCGRLLGFAKLAPDAMSAYSNASKLFGGTDPSSGKVLDEDSRVQAGVELIDNVVSLGGDVGQTLSLLGAAGVPKVGAAGSAISGAATTAGPPAALIVTMALLQYQALKGGRDFMNAAATLEVRERFSGQKPAALLGKISTMPVSPANSVLTAQRLAGDNTFKNVDTAARYRALLTREIGKEDTLKLIAGKGNELSPARQAVVGEAARRVALEFINLELGDVRSQFEKRTQSGSYLTRQEQKDWLHR